MERLNGFSGLTARVREPELMDQPGLPVSDHEEALRALGVAVDVHGKMPDVVIHHVEKDWLVLVEAVTSHGPVNPKRREELAALFGVARPGLVYVTAFLTRSDMARYIGEISWETEVWVQEAATHLIHFDGKRFLGPYDG